MKRFLVISLVLLSLNFAPSGGARAQQQQTQEEEVTLNLRGVDGKNYRASDMRGHVLLVSFGATWCQPCVQELRALEQLKSEYKDKPVKILWASIEGENEVSDSKLRDFARSLKLTFPVLRDSDRFTYAQFSQRARIPLVVFFDKQGNYVSPPHLGMSTPETYKNKMRGMLDKLLAAQTSQPQRAATTTTKPVTTTQTQQTSQTTQTQQTSPMRTSPAQATRPRRVSGSTSPN